MHDRYCPLDALDPADCAVCRALRDARREEYARGWLDGANGRPAAT